MVGKWIGTVELWNEGYMFEKERRKQQEMEAKERHK